MPASKAEKIIQIRRFVSSSGASFVIVVMGFLIEKGMYFFQITVTENIKYTYCN